VDCMPSLRRSHGSELSMLSTASTGLSHNGAEVGVLEVDPGFM
jgi:hypothetical protein